MSQQTEAQTLISSKEAQIAEIQDQITDNANLLADLKAKAEEAKRLQEEARQQPQLLLRLQRRIIAQAVVTEAVVPDRLPAETW